MNDNTEILDMESDNQPTQQMSQDKFLSMNVEQAGFRQSNYKKYRLSIYTYRSYNYKRRNGKSYRYSNYLLCTKWSI